MTEVGSRGWGRRSRSKHCLGSASYCPVPCHQSQLQDGRNKDKTKNKGKKKLSKFWLAKCMDEIQMAAEQWLQNVLWTAQGGGTRRTKAPSGSDGRWFTWEPWAEVGGDEGSQCTPDLGQPSCPPHPPPKLMRFALSPRRVLGKIQSFPIGGHLQILVKCQLSSVCSHTSTSPKPRNFINL